jgi:hypothetical protein
VRSKVGGASYPVVGISATLTRALLP